MWSIPIALLLAANAAQAATRYVGGCGSPTSGTIAAAITAVSAGDTILVCPGTYNEAVTVNKDTLTIRGSTGNRADVTVSNNNIPFTLTGAATTLKDMTVTSTNNKGIYRGWTGSPSAYTFENLNVTAKDKGVYIEVSTKVTFTNVSVTASNDDAIHLASSTNGEHVFDTVTATGKKGIYSANGGVTFKDVTVTATDIAISINPKYDATFTNVTATSSNERGIYMGWVSSGKTIDFSNVNVTAKGHGIYVDVSGKLTFTDVTVTSSNDDAIRLGWDTTGAHVFDTVTATAKKYGIYTSRGGATFKDLTVNATDNDAIYINRPDYAAAFTNVTATSSGDDGINIGWVASGNALTFSNVNVSAKNRGIYIDTSAAVSIQDSVVSSSNDNAIELGYGANGAHVLRNLTLDADESGILYGAGAPSATIGNVCVNSGKYGVRITQWGSKNVAISGSLFTSSDRGVYVNTDPTYKTTVSGSCIMKSTTPRAYSNSTTHTFNGNYWLGVAGGTNYTDGNVRDNSTLASCPATSCYTPATPSPAAEYRFDECSWTSGAADAVTDSVGGYHGTPYGVTTASGGVVQNAADLSASGTSDYIHWPVGLMNGRSDFTISLWFKTSVSQSQQEILHGLGSGTGDDEIEIYLKNTTKIRVNLFDSGDDYTAGSSFVDGDWHHLAVTRSGNSVCVYLDTTSLGCNTRGSGALSITDANALLTGQEQDSYGGGFSDGQSLRAQLDEFKVFASALNSTQIANIRTNELAGNNWDGTTRAPACVASPDHIRLIHDGSAIACAAESVTVRACANADCSSLYTGGVVTGNLTAGGNSKAFTIASGASETTVGIHLPASTAVADPQTVRLGTSSVDPAPLGTSPDCTNTTTSTTNTTTACDVGVSKAAFLFDVPTLTAGAASGNVSVQAVKSADSTTCVPLFQNVTRTVAFWGNYQNPATGTMSVQVNGSNVETTSSPAYTSTYSLAFDATGIATLTSVRYDDAGQMQLGARYTGSSANTPPDGGMIVTGSDSFVVKPYGFVLSNIRQTALPNLVNPAAADASGAKFVKAGEAFSVTVEAVTADGTTATPNYGQETTAESVKLTSALVGGLGLTNNPAVAGSFGTFSGGSAIGTAFTWGEVGIISLTPSVGDGDYLGAGDITGTTIDNVGRFYPDRFAITPGALTDGCGAFTYLGQDGFSTDFTLTAQNVAGDKTQNYAGSFAKLALNNWNDFVFTAAGLPAGSALAASATAPAGNWVTGEAAVSARHQASRPTVAPDAPSAPATATVSAWPVDSDGVTLAAAVAVHGGTVALRYGRLRLSNAFGSEKSDLSMSMRAQYWSGNSWVPNNDDSCTDATLSFAPVGTDITGMTCVWDTGSPGNSEKGCAAAAPAGRQYMETGVAGFAGNFNVWLKAPGSGNSGTIDVTATVPAWLQYTWAGTLGNPKARATFGIYSPETKRTVHIREQF